MQGSRRLIGTGAALLAGLGLGLFTPAGWLAAVVVALLAGGLVAWVLRPTAVPAPKIAPAMRRADPVVAAPAVAVSSDAAMAAPVAALVSTDRPATAEPVRPPLFATTSFGDNLPEAARLPGADRLIAPSGDALLIPAPRGIPDANRSIYADAEPPVAASAPAPGADRDAMSEEGSSIEADTLRAAGVHGRTPDRLRSMRGLGLPAETALYAAGVTRFEQIAAWDDAEIERVAAKIGHAARRIRASDWVGQAGLLAERKRAGAA